MNASAGSIYNRTLQNVNLNNFAPRLGVAFTPRPTQAIRAGYALSYIQFNRTNSVGEVTANAPFIIDSLQPQVAPVVSGGLPLCTTAAATNCFNSTQMVTPQNL